MRRLICISLIALLVCGCAAPSSSSSYEDGYAAGFSDGVASVIDQQLSEAFAPTAEPAQAAEPASEPAVWVDDAPTSKVFISEDENVKIEFERCELKQPTGRESLVFYVENKTDVELTFQASAMAIDGENLGHVSGSDSIAARSRGKIRFTSAEAFPTMTPANITGTIRVIDFSKTLLDKQSYDVSFTEVSCIAEAQAEDNNESAKSIAAAPVSEDVVNAFFERLKNLLANDAFEKTECEIESGDTIHVVILTALKNGSASGDKLEDMRSNCKDIIKSTLILSNDLLTYAHDDITKSNDDSGYWGGMYDYYNVHVEFQYSDGVEFYDLYASAGSNVFVEK